MSQYNPFIEAKPVWGEDLLDRQNCQIGFLAKITEEIKKITESVTGQYLSGRKQILIPKKRRKPNMKEIIKILEPHKEKVVYMKKKEEIDRIITD